MPDPRHGRVAVIGLIILLTLSSTGAFALTLPNPPDTSAPANNQNGPLPSSGAGSFAGGVYLVKDSSADQNVSENEMIARYYCTTGTATIAKQYKSAIGESISGPISNEQASGIIEAMSSIRPPATVSLSTIVRGLAFAGLANFTYTLTAITYNMTSYSIWTTTQRSPEAEQRVGYVVVSVPEQLQVTRASQDSSEFTCPPVGDTTLGAGFGPDSFAWLTTPLTQISTPPKDGVAPILSYGTVKVTSGAGVAAVARISPGENATFVLPPGTYSAVADVALFGIPFGVGSGTYSSPEGATAAQFTVSLNNVESLWYALEVAAVIILIAVVLVISKKFHLWAVVTQASARLFRAISAVVRKSRDELTSQFRDSEPSASRGTSPSNGA